jgi:hypothetical protein
MNYPKINQRNHNHGKSYLRQKLSICLNAGLCLSEAACSVQTDIVNIANAMLIAGISDKTVDEWYTKHNWTLIALLHGGIYANHRFF